MTTDTSFIENPPSSRAPIKFANLNSGLNKRGGGERRTSRGSGIARGKLRGKT